MSTLSLIEVDHDFCPEGDDASLILWATQMRTYMRTLKTDDLPPGVKVRNRRHSSGPDPIFCVQRSLTTDH